VVMFVWKASVAAASRPRGAEAARVWESVSWHERRSS
jgi:hypothetical protein